MSYGGIARIESIGVRVGPLIDLEVEGFRLRRGKGFRSLRDRQEK